MDVRFVSDEGIQQHPVGELERLLARDHGLVWVDIPVCDEEAARVLAEVFGFHPLAIRACIELGTGGHVHYVELDQFIGPRYGHRPRPAQPGGHARGRAARDPRGAGADRGGTAVPGSPSELPYAIVSALAEGQEAFVEAITREVWPPEQRVTSGQLGDPEQFLEELFGARHALLAVSNMATLGHQLYQRVSALGRFIPPDRQPLVADLEDQFARVGGVADGQVRRPQRY